MKNNESMLKSLNLSISRTKAELKSKKKEHLNITLLLDNTEKSGRKLSDFESDVFMKLIAKELILDLEIIGLENELLGLNKIRKTFLS